ncbi:S1C family serine protease [Halopiger goleimassiliensis]|uniref:S1C family serine protease n=1 Tax=Halopiger goleimassiliensis TaxID=1293048 RepID=UPI00067775CB
MTPNRTSLSRRRLLRSVGAGTAALGFVGTGSSIGRADDGDDLTDSDSDDRTDSEGGQYTAVYEETIDDVVLVTVAGVDEETPGGLGSGFVVDDYVVTNDHVVQGASEVELQFSDEQWRTATVVGTDTYSDLAVLEVEDFPDPVDGLAFADEQAAIGQEVLALGNPLGFDASVSRGIVSGVGRSLPSPTGFSIPAAIQTDAPVDPGNSGGPLVNLEGDVLGVVFAGAGRGIGFAISAALAERVIPSLIEEGTYQHAFMGVGVEPVGPVLAEANDLEEPRGVMIVRVTPNGPADGVLEPATDLVAVDGAPVPVGGDVVVAIDGEPIPNQDRLSSYLALETSPGDEIEVEVVREGERETVVLTLEERPPVDLP